MALPIKTVKKVTTAPTLKNSKKLISIPALLLDSTTIIFATLPMIVRLPANVLLMARVYQKMPSCPILEANGSIIITNGTLLTRFEPITENRLRLSMNPKPVS